MFEANMFLFGAFGRFDSSLYINPVQSIERITLDVAPWIMADIIEGTWILMRAPSSHSLGYPLLQKVSLIFMEKMWSVQSHVTEEIYLVKI